MVDTDKFAFKRMLYTLMELYQKPVPSNDTLRVWFDKLNKYDFQVVSEAIDYFTDHNKHAPNPANILEICQAKTRFNDFDALPKPKLTQDQINENIRRLREIYSKLNPRNDDYKKWAKDILAEVAKGKKYPDISLRFAKEALGIVG